MKVIRHILFVKILRLEIEHSYRPSVVRQLRLGGVPQDDPQLRKNILVYFGVILILFVGSWLFVIAIEKSVEPLKTGAGPTAPWHTAALKKAYSQLPEHLKDSWLWWHMPKPPKREMRFADVIEAKPASVKWHTAAETRALLSMMSDVNLAKVETAKAAGVTMVGGVYKRTRYHHGIKVQRAEVRFDDVAGCLRTPAGGSSRQLILVVDGERIRSRLISTRETARLMGLPDSYELPQAYNEAYHLTGDGVAVPVVRYIAKHILEPVVKGACASESLEKAPTAKAK